MWEGTVEFFIAMYLYEHHEDLYVDWLCQQVKEDRQHVWHAISMMMATGKARMFAGKGHMVGRYERKFPGYRQCDEDVRELAQWEVDGVLRNRLEGSPEETPSDDLLFLRGVNGVEFDDCFENG